MPDTPRNTVSHIFNTAISIEDSEAKRLFLEEVCLNRPPKIRREVDSLLEAYEKSNEIFAHPISVLPEVKTLRTAQSSEDEFPQVFQGYTLLEKIGQGGMGVVYKAEQAQLDRIVALKMLKNGALSTQGEVQRFYAEAQSAAQLNHSSIVPIFEADCVGNQHFFTMGYIDGPNLEEVISERIFTVNQAVDIILQISSAIAFAHKRGIIHRDLKPSNILLTHDSDEERKQKKFRALVSDFGLAKRSFSDERLTLTGEILGTPGFLAPEQITGESSQNSPSADIYSLGALLYYMLTGVPPLEGKNVWDSLQKTVKEEATSLRTKNASIPKDLNTICAKCLRRNIDKRYKTAEDFSADLIKFRNHRPIQAKKVGLLEKTVKLCQRNPTSALACLFGFTLILGSILIPLKLAKTWNKAHKNALHEQAKAIFDNGVMSTRLNNQVECLSQFLESAQLARQIGDKDLENAARWNLGARSQDHWSFVKNFKIDHPIRHFALSPSGAHLAIISEDRRLSVYDTSSGAHLYHTQLTKKTVTLLYKSENTFITAHKNGNISKWTKVDTTYERHHEIVNIFKKIPSDGEKIFLTDVVFSNSGETLISGDTQGRVIEWNFTSLDFNRHIAEDLGPINALTLARESNTLGILANDREHHFLDLSNPFGDTETWTLEDSSKLFSITSCASHFFASKKNAYTGHIVDFKTSSSQNEITKGKTISHSSLIDVAHFSRDGSLLITSSRDGTIRFWDTTTSREVWQALRLPEYSKWVSTSQNGQHLCVGHQNQSVSIWKKPKKKILWQAFLDTDLSGAIFTQKSDQLVVSERTEKTRLNHFLRPDPKPVFSPRESDQAIRATFIEKGLILRKRYNSYLSLDRGDKFVREYHLDTNTLISDYGVDDNSIIKMALSHNEDYLFVATQEKSLVYDMRTKKIYPISLLLKNSYDSVVFSSDNKKLIIGSLQGQLKWLDISSGKLIREIQYGIGKIEDLCIEPKLKLLAIASSSYQAAVFDEETFRPVSPPIHHDNRVGWVRFTENGQHLLTATKSNSIQIWDIKTGRPIGNPLTHIGRIRTISLNDNQTEILTTDSKGYVTVWDLPQTDNRSFAEIQHWIETEKFPKAIWGDSSSIQDSSADGVYR